MERGHSDRSRAAVCKRIGEQIDARPLADHQT
jgi:hypothetical protein